MKGDSLPLGIPTFFKSEELDELEALIPHLNHIRDENIKSLRHSLASRIHLEKLVERYWERKVEKDIRRNDQEERTEGGADEEQGEQEEDGLRGEESLEELRLRIIEHPVYSTFPNAFRWPISTSQLATPRWSFADEIMAILSKEVKKATAVVPASKSRADTSITSIQVQDDVQHQFTAQEFQTPPDSAAVAAADADDDDDDDDEDVDEIVSSFAIPTIRQCQNSLQFLLDLLSNRIPIGRENGQKRLKRKDIITWRDVLKSIKSQSESSFLPKEVIQKIEDRMRSISGSQTILPSAALLSNLGRDGTLSKLIQNQTPISLHQSEKFSGLFADNDQVNKRNSLQKRLREMDQDLFLSQDYYRRSLLQPAPNEGISLKRKR